MLHVTSRCKQYGWLEEHDKEKLKDLIRELRYRDYTEIHRKRALTLSHLNPIINQLDLDNIIDLHLATAMMFGHDGLMRSGEILSGLRTSDVLWNADRNAFQVKVKRTKTTRTGEGVWIGFQDYGGINSVTLMKLYYSKMGYWGKINEVLFPAKRRFSKIRFNYNVTASKEWFRRSIQKLCNNVGLDGKQYSGHSLRAGGATDLFLAGVPYYIIKKMGRWSSDAALIYFRKDEEVIKLVCKAFKRMNKKF